MKRKLLNLLRVVSAIIRLPFEKRPGEHDLFSKEGWRVVKSLYRTLRSGKRVRVKFTFGWW
jgi:hypothetical protein